ncbi:Uncharacterised protein [Klebsiella grimontii]|nr:Uncharacterised protein [Klebsiella grimontii]
MLVEISERGFFILKKIDPARFLILFAFRPDLPDKPRFLIDRLGQFHELTGHLAAEGAIKGKVQLQ